MGAMLSINHFSIFAPTHILLQIESQRTHWGNVVNCHLAALVTKDTGICYFPLLFLSLFCFFQLLSLAYSPSRVTIGLLLFLQTFNCFFINYYFSNTGTSSTHSICLFCYFLLDLNCICLLIG